MANGPYNEYSEDAIKEIRDNPSYLRSHVSRSQITGTTQLLPPAQNDTQSGTSARNMYRTSISPSFASYFEHQDQHSTVGNFSRNETYMTPHLAGRPIKSSGSAPNANYLGDCVQPQNTSGRFIVDREYSAFDPSYGQPPEPLSTAQMTSNFGHNCEKDLHNTNIHPYNPYKCDPYASNAYSVPQPYLKSQQILQHSKSPRKGSKAHSRSQSTASYVEGVVKTHKRTNTKGHRRHNSSRNVDFDNGNMSMALITPTFVPGMPLGSTLVGPRVLQRPPGGHYWALISLGSDNDDPDFEIMQYNALSKHSQDDIMTLPIQMCQPPLCNILPAYPQALDANPQPRMRKQSKYTAGQDELILELKSQGKGWAEIAKQAHCHNQLAARNRYQVLIGQQGGGTFVWTNEDCAALQDSLDEGERAKWLYIATELSKKLGKTITLEMVHYKVASIFAEQPQMFGIIRTTDSSRGGAPFERATLYNDEN